MHRHATRSLHSRPKPGASKIPRPRLTVARLAPPALDWEDVRFFTVLARQHTLRSAARVLDSTPARVERRLRNLESALGQTLFSRRADGFRLNSAGAAALAEAAQMEMAACSLLQRRAASVR